MPSGIASTSAARPSTWSRTIRRAGHRTSRRRPLPVAGGARLRAGSGGSHARRAGGSSGASANDPNARWIPTPRHRVPERAGHAARPQTSTPRPSPPIRAALGGRHRPRGRWRHPPRPAPPLRERSSPPAPVRSVRWTWCWVQRHAAGHVIGSLSTDARGVYDGAVSSRATSPPRVRAVAVTPGDARCAPAVTVSASGCSASRDPVGQPQLAPPAGSP